MRVVLFFLFCCSSIISYAQKPFVGKLVYIIEIADTSQRELFPTDTMTVYTNDTLIRIETHTAALGQQVLIQHLTKQKAYLLINSQLGKFAVQVPDVNKSESKYSFVKGKGKKVICGLKSARLIVKHADVTGDMEFYYTKNISSKYLPGFENFKGLLTDYYTVTQDGVYHHRLVECVAQPISHDLFGIPSDYQKLSMSEFVDVMTGKNEEEK